MSTDRCLTEYRTEIEALERCCQHRTHCFIHIVVGLLKVRSIQLLLFISSVSFDRVSQARVSR